jgi:hypothetical protein
MSLWNYERASNGTDASGGETAFARRLRSQPIIQHRQTQTLAVCSAVFSEKMNTGFPKKKVIHRLWISLWITFGWEQGLRPAPFVVVVVAF